MTTPPSPPTPRLRQGPQPAPTSGRRVVIGAFLFFLLLLGFVLTLVFTIGIHNNGVKPPPPPPTGHSSR
jgi:hypothetical protein